MEWGIEKELAIKHYEVEKSTNGQQFSSAITVNAKANDNSTVNYQWLDVAPVVGDNYYRIKSTDITGQIQYSDVVKVVMVRVIPQITVYPNPVVNDRIVLHLVDQPAGTYQLRLFNSLGQQLLVQQLQHAGGSNNEVLQLKRFTHGTYHLEVLRPDKSKTDIKIVY